MRAWLCVAGINGLLAVALAAAAQHALGATTAEAALAGKAAEYQMYHALALLGLALLAERRGGVLVHAAGLAFTGGIVLFCGSLYAMAFAGAAATLVTPTGGGLLMLGWLLLGLAGVVRRPQGF